MKYIALTAACFLMAISMAWAQDPDLPAEEVEIIKSFDARLVDAERYQVDPELPPLDTSTRNLQYDVFSRTLAVDYLPPKIRPLAIRRERLAKGYDGYLRLGGGFPAAFYGKGLYNINNDDNLSIDIFGNHHSANNSQQLENQRFSFSNAGVDGTYHFDQGFAVNANLMYTSDAVHYYGYNNVAESTGETLSFDQEEVRQRFSIFDAGAKIFNSARTVADFNYYAGFQSYFMNDSRSASRENGFDLLLGGTKWFNEKHPLAIELQTDFTNYSDLLGETNLNNFFLRPNFTYHADRFRAKLGFNLASNDDNFTFFPDLEVTAVLLETLLNAYVGAGGTLQKNSYRNMTDYNPFITSSLRVANSLYYNFYGGVRGNFQGVDYDIGMEYKSIEDLVTYRLLEPFDSIPMFTPIYDNGTITTIKGSFDAPLTDEFEIVGAFSQSFFSLDNEEKAWHLPALSINVGGRYTTMEDKLTLKADFFLENGVPYVNEDGEADNLNALFDISVGADFYFTDNIGGFLQVNNLANNKRERWFRYPIFGINAMAGVTARF
jgi:hypothetical protein